MLFVGEQIKKRWRNLRDTYAKHIRVAKTRKGQATKRNRTWIWANQMKDFDSYLRYETTSNVSNIESIENFENGPSKSEQSKNNVIVDAPDFQIEQIYSQFMDDQFNASTLTPNASTSREASVKRNSEAPSVGEVIKYFEGKREPEYDAIDYIFLGYAKTIKTFSGTRQAVTKMKIAQVVMEQELLHQQELDSRNEFTPESASSCINDFSNRNFMIKSENAQSSSTNS